MKTTVLVLGVYMHHLIFVRFVFIIDIAVFLLANNA